MTYSNSLKTRVVDREINKEKNMFNSVSNMVRECQIVCPSVRLLALEIWPTSVKRRIFSGQLSVCPSVGSHRVQSQKRRLDIANKNSVRRLLITGNHHYKWSLVQQNYTHTHTHIHTHIYIAHVKWHIFLQ